MLRRLIPYLKGYGMYAVLSPLLVMLETVCELLMPLQMANIIDKGIPSGDMREILTSGAIMFALAVIAMVSGTYSSKAASFAAQGMGANRAGPSSIRLPPFPLQISTAFPHPPLSPV